MAFCRTSKTIGGLAGLVAATALPVLVLVAQPSWAAGCSVYAGSPTNYGGGSANVYGEGGRSGCASKTYVKVRLRWNRPLSPDPDIDWLGGQYTNVTLVPGGDCLPGKHEYYVDTTADSGGYATSDPRRSFSCS